ncbi:hypothetical protein EJB05_04357 [Eragrostis curvula]|uniref:Uncharacterized protein n=1 Tax=Eragrostis curvula TaxID=38414 RepID=A0A5J9WC45_9POAL|nr:hypothetical protein EJB05_04357 [Eragrostis curvula]
MVAACGLCRVWRVVRFSPAGCTSMSPLSVKSNLAHCVTSYRFRFRCYLVEFLSGSTSQGFDVRPLIVECGSIVLLATTVQKLATMC